MRKSLLFILLITCMLFSLSAVVGADFGGRGDNSVSSNMANTDLNEVEDVKFSTGDVKNDDLDLSSDISGEKDLSHSNISSKEDLDFSSDVGSKEDLSHLNINSKKDLSHLNISSKKDLGLSPEIVSNRDSSVSTGIKLLNSTTLKGNYGTFTELQLLIIAAKDGDVIKLTRNYKYDNKFIKTGIFINKNITINGNGHTIDGRGIARIFNINYGKHFHFYKVILENIKFKNGHAKIYGGAILNFADLTVKNCYFTNNYAGTAGGAINSLGALNLKNSKFNRNSAGGDAGAVFSLTLKKGAEFYEEFFKDINATEDLNLLFSIIMSAVLEHGKDHISNCVFTNNVAKGTGGGAVYAFSHIDIRSSTFNSNKAKNKGGAVYGCKNLFIKNSKFNKNKVSMYGGAIFFKCHEQSGHYVKGKWVSTIRYYKNLIESSTFTYNVAGQRGGAIYGFRTSDSDKIHCAKAIKCTFSNNKAPSGKDIYGGVHRKCVYKNTKIYLKTLIVKRSAKNLIMQASFKIGSAALKSKLVTFKFNGIAYKVKTNSKGIAKAKITSKILRNLKIGNIINYSASFNGVSAKKAAKVLR
ncbi:hypothetical protein [uncultured Methanobrevibacter sp.]|uniref:hypothetical protein n=1 Tax=uncultured Methanobrevibacter sp. TaxID=253161 RepID=UPI0025CC16DB|nr:hypothetical protein [uncultured Methanobrevibacter sp.]